MKARHESSTWEAVLGDTLGEQLSPKKPSAGLAPHVNIKAEYNGLEVYFKLRITTPFARLMHAFCMRQGINPRCLRFEVNSFCRSSPRTRENRLARRRALRVLTGDETPVTLWGEGVEDALDCETVLVTDRSGAAAQALRSSAMAGMMDD